MYTTLAHACMHICGYQQYHHQQQQQQEHEQKWSCRYTVVIDGNGDGEWEWQWQRHSIMHVMTTISSVRPFNHFINKIRLNFLFFFWELKITKKTRRKTHEKSTVHSALKKRNK